MKITATPSIGDDVKDVIYTCQKAADAAGHPIWIDARKSAQNATFIVYPNGNPLMSYVQYQRFLEQDGNTQEKRD